MFFNVLKTILLKSISILYIFVSSIFICNSVSAERYFQFDSFDLYVVSAFSGKGLKDFETITADVKNNIFWRSKANKNKYEIAYTRSIPHLKKMFRDDIPDFIFLIPYLESGWQAKKGRKKTDYGYWQLVREIVTEIKTLNQASDALRNTHPDKIRSDPTLSTEVALIHLKRYYFYFRHVANFSEADAWFFSVTAYNWGVGNVKRALIKVSTEATNKGKGDLKLTFSDFYHYLYQQQKNKPKDISMRAALEYLPNLWNISLLIQSLQQEEID